VTWPTGGAVTTTSQERSREAGRGGEAAPVSFSGAAFFDLDRTLIAGSSAFEFARASYKAGLTTRRQLASDGLANLRFRLEGSTDQGTEVLKERVMGALSGVRVRDIERLGADVLGGLLPRVYPQMLEIAYGHQDAGRPVFICTAASQEVADLLGHVLTFDGAIGTRSEIVDGAYTGRLDGPFTYREGKAQAVRELAAERGLDLDSSWAYSDSESDLPMLRAVGHPVAVNPDSALARIADEEGWEVVRFETLGRRLKLGGALVTAALAGGIGGAVVRRRAPARRIPARPRLPRR
jgi:HAD superfamily hydrolase (TIGR01490 family)